MPHLPGTKEVPLRAPLLIIRIINSGAVSNAIHLLSPPMGIILATP